MSWSRSTNGSEVWVINMAAIYALVDPKTDLIGYIGQSYDPKARFFGHLSKPCSKNMQSWLNNVGKPELRVLETCEKRQVDSRERWWIAFGKSVGWPLVNTLSGGKVQYTPIKTVQERLHKTHGPSVRLVENTYTTVAGKAVFVDEERGSWEATVNDVLRGCRHPSRKYERRHKKGQHRTDHRPKRRTAA